MNPIHPVDEIDELRAQERIIKARIQSIKRRLENGEISSRGERYIARLSTRLTLRPVDKVGGDD